MLYQRYQPQFHRLHRLWDVLPVLTAEEQDYVGVFIPGTLLSQLLTSMWRRRSAGPCAAIAI
nr:hypothetical protein [Edwardsiella ictaluri]